MELNPNIHEKIEAISEEGNVLLEKGEWQAAIEKWDAALTLVPDPKPDWEASTWLYASMGDAYFEAGNFNAAKESLFDALNCPGGIDNPFIHYRLGQALIKLGETEKGMEQLLQTYMLDGDDIFLSEEGGEVYLDILRNRGLLS